MENVTVTAFKWAPPFAQGLVRDLRVRWALREAGLPYQAQLIGFTEKDSPENLAHHPFGLVPAFAVDGAALFESGAILHRIALNSDALMPADAAGREQTLVWMFAALNTVEPPLSEVFAIDRLFEGEAWASLRRPGAIESARKRLAALATWLDGRDYLTGRFTVADILMTTVLRFVRHTELLSEQPAIAAYLQRCEARPAFGLALDEQMEDYARHEPVAA